MRNFLYALFFSLFVVGAWGQQLTLTSYQSPDGGMNLANFKLRAVATSQLASYTWNANNMERGFIFSNNPVNPFSGLTTFSERQQKVVGTPQLQSGTWEDNTSPTSNLAFPNDFKHVGSNTGISNASTFAQSSSGRWGFQHTSTLNGVTLRTGGRYYVTAYFIIPSTQTIYWSNTIAIYSFDAAFSPNSVTAVGCGVNVNFNDYPNENVSPYTFQGFERFYNYYDIDGNLIDVIQTPTTQDPFSVENGYSVDGVTITTATLSSFEVTIAELPLVTAPENQIVCSGSMVILSGGGAQSYEWDNGINNGVGFAASTTQTYTVTGTDDNGCANTATTTISVNDLPTVSATPSQTVCDGESVTLSGSGAVNYSWTGGITNGVSFTPAVGVNSYTVTGTDANGCTNTATRTITVNALPTVSATANQTVCVGTSVTLSGSGADTYSWTGGISDGVAFTPSVGLNTFTVTGTGANGCTNTATRTVTVNALPTVSATANQTVCAGTSVSLFGSGAETYSWTGGISDGVAFTPSVGVNIYTVTGTGVNGCANTATSTVTVNANPTVSATANQTVCAGTSVTLFGSGAETYSWTGGISDGVAFTPSVGVNNYTVTGTGANGCTNTATRTVTVNGLPSYTFQGNTSICLGQNTDLTVLNSPSGVNSIIHDWNTGASTATINVSPLTTTTYTYTGTSSGGCSSTQQVTVTVNPLPSVNAGSNQTVCPGSVVTLTGSGAATYNWVGGTPNTATYTFTATSSNTYTLMGFDNNGCSNTDEVLVIVSSPTVTATSNHSSICSSSNTSVTLTAGGANTYVWSNGINTSTALVTPTSTTTYTVTGTDNNGCTNTAQVTINVDSQNSGGQVYGTSSYCSGASVSELHIAGHGGTIQWQSSTDNSTFENIIGAIGVTYVPGILTQTTYYRGLVTNGSCTAYSLTGTVNIVSGGWIGAAGTTLINGVQSYDLSNPLNWCGGVPSTPTIPNGVTVYVDGSYDFTNVTIECGGQLVITETGRVNITNVLTNGGIVQVINGGTIKIGTKVDGSCPGTYKYSETFSPSRYWYVGPTTSNTVRTDFGSVASTNNPTGTQMWSWNETANATNGYITPIYSLGTTLIPGNGYVYRNLGNTTLDVNVTGPYITSSISHTGLTRTGSGTMAGYHLLSNPYTAYLDADQILTQNLGTVNMVSSMWVRSNTSSTGGVSTMVFDTYNAASGIGTGLGWQIAALNGNTTEINNLLKWIAPMQGFWVRVNNSGTGSVAYNYAMTEANPAGAGQLRSTSPITALARLNVNFGGQKDQMVAALSANATNGLEAFDSEKMFTSGVVQVYAPNSGKKLAINTLKNNKSKVSMPLTVECPGSGWYSFDLVELILENGVVFLEDKLNGGMKDLTIDSSYQFYANSGVLQNRFILHFHLPSAISNVTGPSAIEDLVSESQSATIDITSTGSGKVTVALDQVDEVTNSSVRVCDLNGRVVDSFMADGKLFEFQINQGQGAYLIEVTNGLTVEKKKVFIQ